MQCVLKEVEHPVWPGRTFFTKSVSGDMLPAAVYMPPNHNPSANMLNVLLFLHGYYVGSTAALTNSDNCRLCEQVINSGRDIVLVAPWLGYKWGLGAENGTLQTGRLANAKYGESFLKAILAALPVPRAAAAPPPAAPAAAPGADAVSGAGTVVNAPKPPKLDIANLILACHSAGGVGMRNIVRTLGAFEAKLKECVGLDCLYTGGNDGDAKFWYNRAREPGVCPEFFYYGPSTIPESVKLYLMAQGRADALGDLRDPAGTAQTNLVVRPGHISSFMSGGVTTHVSSYIDNVVDDLIAKGQPAPAKPASAKPAAAKAPPNGEFVHQAARSFANGYIFPVREKDERGGIHYFIARAFLLERLKNAALP